MHRGDDRCDAERVMSHRVIVFVLKLLIDFALSFVFKLTNGYILASESMFFIGFF